MLRLGTPRAGGPSRAELCSGGVVLDVFLRLLKYCLQRKHLLCMRIIVEWPSITTFCGGEGWLLVYFFEAYDIVGLLLIKVQTVDGETPFLSLAFFKQLNF